MRRYALSHARAAVPPNLTADRRTIETVRFRQHKGYVVQAFHRNVRSICLETRSMAAKYRARASHIWLVVAAMDEKKKSPLRCRYPYCESSHHVDGIEVH